jgi:hypothetical protein
VQGEIILKYFETFLGAVYERGSCYVRVLATATYAVAKQSCNHMKNGHLYYLSEDDLIDKLIIAMVETFKKE